MAFHRLNKLAVKRYLHFWRVESYRIGCVCISGGEAWYFNKKTSSPRSLIFFQTSESIIVKIRSLQAGLG